MTSRTPAVSRRDVNLITPLSALRGSPPELDNGEDNEEKQSDKGLILLQQLVEASTDAAKGQRELITEQRAVERAAPTLKSLTKSDWIKFKAAFDAYEFIGGTYKIVRQIDQHLHSFCAAYICNISQSEFVRLSKR